MKLLAVIMPIYPAGMVFFGRQSEIKETLGKRHTQRVLAMAGRIFIPIGSDLVPYPSQ